MPLQETGHHESSMIMRLTRSHQLAATETTYVRYRRRLDTDTVDKPTSCYTTPYALPHINQQSLHA